MAGKRRPGFGSVRRLPSGRYQVRYYGPDGRRRSAPETFERKTDAERYLSLIEVQIMRDEWTDPDRGRVLFKDYADRWMKERPGLSPRTVQLHTWLLTKNIYPELGSAPISKITTPMVREWRAGLMAAGASQSIAAKSYRLLRGILMTAVNEDRLLGRNPCQIKGADRESPEERPVLSVAQVFELADLMPHSKYRLLIVVAAFCSLRWGEVTGLRRCDIAPDGSWIRIASQFIEISGRGLIRTLPKSRAGVRTIAVPEAIRGELVEHLGEYVGTGQDALVFTLLGGKPIRRGNFNPLVKWREQATKIGVPSLRFHDLRHTGNTLAAGTGASLRDLMARMGQDSAWAALIYQHASREADRAIADRLSSMVVEHRGSSSLGHAEGT